jgi:hypothetical protein
VPASRTHDSTEPDHRAVAAAEEAIARQREASLGEREQRITAALDRLRFGTESSSGGYLFDGRLLYRN